MNETESKSPVTPMADSTQAQIEALQRQVTTLMLALLIASGTFCIYMWRQARIARIDLRAFKIAAVQNIQAFEKQKPEFDAFVGKLAEYGKNHPDFAPIISKYRISISTNAPPAGTAASKPGTPAAPAPAPAPAQPKK